MRPPGQNKIRVAFSEAHAGEIAIRPARKRKPPPPTSIRFNHAEREQLERDAGSMTLSAYIRLVLFGPAAEAYKSRRPKRKPREPRSDEVLLSQLLAILGQSRLASNFNQIVKLAHSGSLPVTPELEDELREACAAIKDMRLMLITALGIKSR